MEQKNRLLIALAITGLMAVAIFTSFGRGFFTKSIPEIVLPAPDTSQSSSSSVPSPSASDQVQRVEVKVDTVQSVIASLDRSPSYFREVELQSFWTPEHSTTTTVRTWVDDGWTRTTQILPSGLIRHDIVGDGTLYYWYDGERSWRTAPADNCSADLAQHIPTYETVLTLDPRSITDAGYQLCGDQPCIYVQVKGEVAGYEDRYWISVDNGLLIQAETLEEGALIYRMTSFSPIQSLGAADMERFVLPDGVTVLHRP